MEDEEEEEAVHPVKEKEEGEEVQPVEKEEKGVMARLNYECIVMCIFCKVCYDLAAMQSSLSPPLPCTGLQ